MSMQLGMFKTNLEEFASKHKQEIQKEPEFPGQFLDTCVALAWISSPLEEDFGLRWGVRELSVATWGSRRWKCVWPRCPGREVCSLWRDYSKTSPREGADSPKMSSRTVRSGP
ncbi:unnamed protein product [Gulo gulo]|uniref:Uncharacterized protein n=1 Tax=Gulo gulo TaxID=48420 RepID=A0A9X9LH44_GULGU|nr:unnamed protein product [Gulo gulo]